MRTLKEKGIWFPIYLLLLFFLLNHFSWVSSFILLLVIYRIFQEKNILLWLLLGMMSLLFMLRLHFSPSLSLEEHSSIHGNILIYPHQTQIDGDHYYGKAKLTFDQNTIPIWFSYRIKSEIEKKQIQQLASPYNQSISGKIILPEKNRNFDTFDWQRYLKSQNIFYQVDISSFSSSRIESSGVLAWVWTLRNNLMNQIRQRKEDGLGNLYALSLLFGERMELDDTIGKTYMKLGIFHLLAISGVHVTILLHVSLHSLWRLGVTRETSYIYVLFILVSYGFMIGWGISGTRAILMGIIYLVGKRIKSLALSSLDALSLVCIGILFWNPFILYHPAFQLSYGLSIMVILVSRFVTILDTSYWIQQGIIILLVPLLAFPLICFHFYEFSIHSILFGILMGAFFSRGFIAYLWMYLGFILFRVEQYVVFLFDGVNFVLFGLHWLLNTVAYASNWFTIVVGRGTAVYWITYYIVIALIVEYLGKFGVKVSYRLIVYGCLLVAILYILPYQWHEQWMVVDVGQGDASVLIYPGKNQVYLIDTGGSVSFTQEKWKQKKHSSHAERTIIPALKSQGISTIQKIFLSHADKDHMGNLDELLQEFTIHEICIAEGMETHPAMQEIMSKFPHLTIHPIASPTQWIIEKDTYSFLAPTHASNGENEDSLIIHIQKNKFALLFLGDIDTAQEETLLHSYPNLQANFLKAAHHGSKNASSLAFLQKISPQLTIFSAGKNNRYHHPATEVLERLDTHHLSYFRTDKDGAIRFNFSSSEVRFETCLSKQKGIWYDEQHE